MKSVLLATACLSVCLLTMGADVSQAAQPPAVMPPPAEVKGEGWVKLYNGRNLDNWLVDPGHIGHWQPMQERLVYDGNSAAKDKRTKSLWSLKDYGDMELFVDWRWTTTKPVRRKQPVTLPTGGYALDANGKKKEVEVDDYGDSGIFLRGKNQVNMWCWPIVREAQPRRQGAGENSGALSLKRALFLNSLALF